MADSRFGHWDQQGGTISLKCMWRGHANSAPDWVTVRIDMSTRWGNGGGFCSAGELPESAAVSMDLLNVLGQRVHQTGFTIVEAGSSRPPNWRL